MPVQLEGAVPNLFTDAHTRDGNYTCWAFSVRYSWQSGLLQMPVAKQPSPGGARVPAEIVRRHAPVGQLTLTWLAERKGQSPDVPSYEVTGSNATNLELLDFDIQPEAPQPVTDGLIRVFRVSGVYRYAFKEPVEPAVDGAWQGYCAFDKTPPQINLLQPGKFKKVL